MQERAQSTGGADLHRTFVTSDTLPDVSTSIVEVSTLPPAHSIRSAAPVKRKILLFNNANEG